MPEREHAVVRSLRAGDEHAVLELLRAAFGRWPRGSHAIAADEFFRWKHTTSPFGASTLLVAELDGAVAGFLALMPWRLRFGERVYETMRGVDLAVDPSLQRRGVSIALIGAARERYGPEIALGWSNPNERSRRGVLASGRRRVAVQPRFVGPGALSWNMLKRLAVHGGRAAPRVDDAAATAAAVLADDALLERALAGPRAGADSIATARDPEFLRWRYGWPAGYRAVAARGREGSAGIAVFRVQRRGRFSVAQISELLIEGDRTSLARALVRSVRRASEADAIACVLSSRRAAAQCRLVRAPGAVAVAANPLWDDLRPDPTVAGSWALSLGDLELI